MLKCLSKLVVYFESRNYNWAWGESRRWEWWLHCNQHIKCCWLAWFCFFYKTVCVETETNKQRFVNLLPNNNLTNSGEPNLHPFLVSQEALYVSLFLFFCRPK